MKMVENRAPPPRAKNEKLPKESLLFLQEATFAKILAGNDKKLRDRGLKRLRKWLTARSQGTCEFKEDDFMRIWKGLFYCMWMSDKPLVQEELAENISELVHCFSVTDYAINFVKTFFYTMSKEWLGIDQHRLEKFLMLVRRFLRQSFLYLERRNWNADLVVSLGNAFTDILLPDRQPSSYSSPPPGLQLHFIDIFLEELAKVSNGTLEDEILCSLLRPFISHLAACRDGRILSSIQRNILARLILQSSAGVEYQEKFAAWKMMGFPGGNIDSLQLVEDPSDEEMEIPEEEEEDIEDKEFGTTKKVLDPRAGHVDVELPIIDFNPEGVVKLLQEYRFKKSTNAKTRKVIGVFINKFEKLAQGDFPLGMKRVPENQTLNLRKMIEDGAERLNEFEENLRNEESEEESDESASENEEEVAIKKKKVQITKQKKNKEKVQNGIPSLKEKKAARLKKTSLKTGIKKVSGKSSSKLTKKSALLSLKVSESETKDEDSVVTVVKDAKKKRKSLKENGLMSTENHENTTKKKKRLSLSAVEGHSENHDKIKKKKRHSISVVGNVEKSQPASHLDVSVPRAAVNGPKIIKVCDLASPKTSKRMLQESNEEHLESGIVEKRKEKRRASLPASLKDAIVKKPHLEVTQSSKKSKSAWDEPLKEGETEIVITKKDIMARRKSLETANKSLLKNPFASPAPTGLQDLRTPGSSAKKVNFVLKKNTSQATSEYFKTLRENPEIPYDASKKPSHGVLKPSPYNSPINPFYKKRLKLV